MSPKMAYPTKQHIIIVVAIAISIVIASTIAIYRRMVQEGSTRSKV